MAKFNTTSKPKRRWLTPYLTTVASTSQAAAAIGRVYLMEFEVPTTVTVDAVAWENAATVTGNVTVGIYGPIITEETCAGAAVKVQSASTAVGSANTTQTIALTPTVLTPGRYYVALEFDSTTTTFYRSASVTGGIIAGMAQTYDRASGYGALTNPCPAVTTGAIFPGIFVRCQP